MLCLGSVRAVAARIGIGGVWHETNSFARGQTELDDFFAFQYAEGREAFRDTYEGTRTEIGGALAACRGLGQEAVPLLAAAALPGAVVSAAARTALWEMLLSRLEEALPLAGIVLTLHGAMVAEDIGDPESDLVGAVRRLAGDIPIVVTLDLHANPGGQLFAAANAVAGYDTYPHVDQFERGHEAVELVTRLLQPGRRACLAWRRLPLLTCPLGQGSADEPTRGLLALAHRLEEQPQIDCATLLPGYPYADVEELGYTVVVCGTDQAAVEGGADELAEAVWEARGTFCRGLLTPEEAVEKALSEAEGPVVLADVSDNVGGGTPGDGTAILAALLEAGAEDAVVVLCDPEAVRACQTADSAGAGRTVELEVGGKWDDQHGSPVAVRGELVRVEETRYRRSGSFHTGMEIDMGLCAVLNVGGVGLVLTSRRVLPFDADHLRAAGIDLERQRILVTKSAVAWRAAFGEVASRVYHVDGPGICTCRLSSFDYQRVRRPIVPLDPLGLSYTEAVSGSGLR